MNDGYHIIGARQYEAAEFLISLLSVGEQPSSEVLRQAQDRAINRKTLGRAGGIIGLKSRKSGNRWYMSIPAQAREGFESGFKSQAEWSSANRAAQNAISDDWVSVAVRGEISEKIEIPESRVSTRKPRVRVKIGAYEIEADEGFPAEKPAALLRELGGVD